MAKKQVFSRQAVELLSKLRNLQVFDPAFPEEELIVSADAMASAGLDYGERIHLVRKLLREDPASELFNKMLERLHNLQVQGATRLQKALGEEASRHFSFRWEQGFLREVGLYSPVTAEEFRTLMQQPEAVWVRDLEFYGGISISEFDQIMELPELSQARQLTLRHGHAARHAEAIANSRYLFDLTTPPNFPPHFSSGRSL